MITIDGITYDVGVTSISRKAQIVEGPNAGFALDRTKILDVIGTVYDYSATLEVRGMGVVDYDSLYEALTDPAMPHTAQMPYGQTTLSFEYYSAEVSDALVCMIQNKRWGGLQVDFHAMAPGRTV